MNVLTTAAKSFSLTGPTVRQVSIQHNDGDTPDELTILFSDGRSFHLLDAGQDCCEKRSLTCDDDLDGLVGSRLLSIRTRGVTEVSEGKYGDKHEMVFLILQFSNYAITVTSHNEHNGYYGGFALRVMLKDGSGKQLAIAEIDD